MSIPGLTQYSLKLRVGLAALALGLAMAAAAASPVAGQQPSFFAGLFRFGFDTPSGEDRGADLWLRNPVVLDDALIVRSKEGNDSSVYVYTLSGLAEHIRGWRLAPRALGPLSGRRGQSSLHAESVPVITALFAGPAFGDSASRLWDLRDGGFEEVPGGPYMDFVRKGGALIEATDRLVQVNKQSWFECGGSAAPDCAALVTHGLDWAPGVVGGGGRLALGFADTGERRWVCVIDRPGAPCQSDAPNRVAGRQPLFSGNGRLLAAALEQRADQGRGEHESWDIQVLRVSDAGDFTPVTTIPRIALYGAKGQGGDYLAYKGSYTWLGSNLYFQEAATQPRRFARWSEKRGLERFELPSKFWIFSPLYCGSSELRKRFSNPSQGGDDAGLPMTWAPGSDETAAGRVPVHDRSGRDCQAGITDDLERWIYEVIDLYAVQPFHVQGDDRTFLLVQALVRQQTNLLPLERILIYTLE